MPEQEGAGAQVLVEGVLERWDTNSISRRYWLIFVKVHAGPTLPAFQLARVTPFPTFL